MNRNVISWFVGFQAEPGLLHMHRTKVREIDTPADFFPAAHCAG
jgi:hypothetical protein